MDTRTGGFGLGCILAMGMSIIVNKSVWWAIVHLLCSWLYVVWALIVHSTTLNTWLQSVT